MIEQKINIKPLSVNDAWQGRRYKTEEYIVFEKALIGYLLKDNKHFKLLEGIKSLKIELEFGFSNKSSDWDNPIKTIQDILQKKYLFNDSYIYEGKVKKKIVKKGEEYIYFKIMSYEQ